VPTGARGLGQREDDIAKVRGEMGLLGWASALCTRSSPVLAFFFYFFSFSLFFSVAK
jgi:hypothetical protein